MNNQKNIAWINTLKAICIIAVFFVHCQSYYGASISEANQFVHTFYVNAFFFVSGYLLFWKQLSAPRINEDMHSYMLTGGGKLLFNNILFRIILPSIIFSAIEFFPSCIIQGRGIDVGFALVKTIGGGTYWFTSALVVAELILLVLFLFRKKNIWFYTIACLCLGIACMVLNDLGLIRGGVWAWRQGMIALIFLAMGGLYWRYEKSIDKLMRWWFISPLAIIYIIVVLMFGRFSNPLISTLEIQPLGIVASVIACLLLVWLCKRLPDTKLLSFIGKNSIGFYFMSGALPVSLSLVAHKFMTISSVWIMLTMWLVCMVFAYVIVVIINHWFPWLWDLRKISNKDKYV